MPRGISVDHQRIADFCRRHQIQRLAFFGSVLGDSFRPDSDVDVLVWFPPHALPGLFDLIAMQMELSEIVGRTVDLRTPEDLSRLFRDEVIAKAEVEYAA